MESGKVLAGVLGLGFFGDGGYASLLSARNVKAALNLGAIFYSNVAGDHVSGDVAGAADGHRVAPVKVALDLAEHQDFARLDIGGDSPVRTDDDPSVFEVNFSFDFAVHEKVFATADFAADGVRK